MHERTRELVVEHVYDTQHWKEKQTPTILAGFGASGLCSAPVHLDN